MVVCDSDDEVKVLRQVLKYIGKQTGLSLDDRDCSVSRLSPLQMRRANSWCLLNSKSFRGLPFWLRFTQSWSGLKRMSVSVRHMQQHSGRG